MASAIFNKFLENLCQGLLDFSNGVQTYKVALVTSGYAPNKDTHEFRTDLTNEVVGTGYTAGGIQTTTNITLDTANDRIDIAFGNVSWPAATITARGLVIYKSTGAAGTDLLVAYVDFGSDVSSTAAAFAVTFSSPLRFQN